ncbi:hypothetical protein C8J57DRAFT_1015711, partial [Mycena rebaudengoi]
FALYTSPPKTAKYSATWFKQLTFSNATDIIYPAAHKSHAISQWTFSPDIPSGQAATVIAVNEAVPSMEDLAPILQGMESAYSTGSRSVAVTLTVAGESSSHLYHFSKIRMFNHINNNRIPVESAADLIHHFSTTSIIPPALILALENLPIQSRIRGLRSTDFPLWKLSCLLREEWLHEDVLNALAELMYFSHAAGSLEQNPDTLMLPTT